MQRGRYSNQTFGCVFLLQLDPTTGFGVFCYLVCLVWFFQGTPKNQARSNKQTPPWPHGYLGEIGYVAAGGRFLYERFLTFQVSADPSKVQKDTGGRIHGRRCKSIQVVLTVMFSLWGLGPYFVEAHVTLNGQNGVFQRLTS